MISVDEHIYNIHKDLNAKFTVELALAGVEKSALMSSAREYAMLRAIATVLADLPIIVNP